MICLLGNVGLNFLFYNYSGCGAYVVGRLQSLVAGYLKTKTNSAQLGLGLSLAKNDTTFSRVGST